MIKKVIVILSISVFSSCAPEKNRRSDEYVLIEFAARLEEDQDARKFKEIQAN